MSRQAQRLAVGILAHVDAGKTTLAESILYTTGAIRRLGRVDHGDAFLDNYELEKARGITIFSKQAQVELPLPGKGGAVPLRSWIPRGMWIFPRRQRELCRSWTRLSW